MDATGLTRFRGALCYVDAYQKEPDRGEFRLSRCRLGHFDMEKGGKPWES